MEPHDIPLDENAKILRLFSFTGEPSHFLWVAGMEYHQKLYVLLITLTLSGMPSQSRDVSVFRVARYGDLSDVEQMICFFATSDTFSHTDDADVLTLESDKAVVKELLETYKQHIDKREQ